MTEKAEELLDAINSGVVVHFMRYMGRLNQTEYYFRGDTYKKCTKQAESLVRLGLVKVVYKNGYVDSLVRLRNES